jgi:hypothetical protein
LLKLVNAVTFNVGYLSYVSLTNSMQKIYLVVLFITCLGLQQTLAQGQDSLMLFSKANSTEQAADFTPPKAKKGKDGDERKFVIRLLRGANSGNNGEDAKHAPNLSVWISAIQVADSILLKVDLQSDIERINHIYYVNPKQGVLIIRADGGRGGTGGEGSTGLPSEGKRSATTGGYGGNGGRGGNAGNISVTVDSTALAYANCTCIYYSNRAGLGGRGGKGGYGGRNNNAYGNYTAGPGNDGNIGSDGYDGLPIYIRDRKGKLLATRLPPLPIPSH